eukprot:PhM_4_TR16007/c0_g2_i1/m.54647
MALPPHIDCIVQLWGSQNIVVGHSNDMEPRLRVRRESAAAPPPTPPSWPREFIMCHTQSPAMAAAAATTSEQRAAREQMLSDCFERSRHCRGVFLMRTSTSSLYAVGKSSGFVVDLGYEQSSVSCVDSSMNVTESFVTCAATGRELLQLVKEKIDAHKDSDELTCEAHLKTSMRVRPAGTLPDGTNLYDTQLPELYFNPQAVSDVRWRNSGGLRLHDAVARSIARSGRFGEDSSAAAPPDILLCGGIANMKGINTRLRQELSLRNVSGTVLRWGGEDRSLLPYIGSCIAFEMANAASSPMRPLFVTRAEYEERGASVVHSRFP